MNTPLEKLENYRELSNKLELDKLGQTGCA